MCFDAEKRKQIYEKISKVEIQTTETSTKVDSICEKIDRIENTMEKIDYALNGNGKPGIKERLGVLETRILGISAEAAEEAGKNFQEYMTAKNALFTILIAAAGFGARWLIDAIKGAGN